jgi:hypothetical protein
MTTPALNPLSFNAWVQAVGVMSVVLTQNNSGVWGFVDAPLQTVLPQVLNYAEARIQRDIDALQARSSNTYPLTVSNNVLSIPINDFLVIETLELTQVNGSVVVNSWPLVPVSREFIQNCYSGVFSTGMPKYYAMYGDNFGDGANTNVNVLLGPPPNSAYPVRVTGVIRMPSLYQYASPGPADTSYTYISQWLPDLLLMASMIFISAYQRNFSASSDSKDMPVNYEQQYQTLLASAISEENRKKGMGSGWSGYSTPATATPTR